MILFPNAKINLGLNVVEKRVDGFHNIESIFLPIEINDALEVILNSASFNDFEFTSSGILINEIPTNNLCYKAYHLLKSQFNIPPVKMHLHKAIPIGAGLGGGSADAAFTLKLLNDLFSLNLSENQLLNFAVKLGSDCSFFIKNKPCYASSRGEILREIEFIFSDYEVLIVNPAIHISTAWAFSKIIPSKPKNNILQIIKSPINTWRNEILNDFEEIVFNEYNEISNIKDTLYTNNAIYASLTGTGSTVFGLFEKGTKNLPLNFPSNYFVSWTKVKNN